MISFSNSVFGRVALRIIKPDLAALRTSWAASFRADDKKVITLSFSLNVFILSPSFSIIVLIATQIFSLTPFVLVLPSERAADTNFESVQFSHAFTKAFSASSAMNAFVSAAFLSSIGITLSSIQSTLLPKFSKTTANVPKAFLDS